MYASDGKRMSPIVGSVPVERMGTSRYGTGGGWGLEEAVLGTVQGILGADTGPKVNSWK
jgi:hypothetical protein